MPCTVKQSYSEHAYNEFTLIVKRFSFPVVLKQHIMKSLDIMNEFDSESKSLPLPPKHFTISKFYCDTDVIRVFTLLYL